MDISEDLEESVGSNIDDAYKAIEDFEKRRSMQQRDFEIKSGTRRVQGYIHATQRM